MSSAPREYLLHILAEADYLLAKSKGLTLSGFQADETLLPKLRDSIAHLLRP